MSVDRPGKETLSNLMFEEVDRENPVDAYQEVVEAYVCLYILPNP